jgi:phosphate starvation-inducible protein PhoH and related proteins
LNINKIGSKKLPEEKQTTFSIEGVDPLIFYGVNDRNINIIDKSFPVTIIARGNSIKLIGDEHEVNQVEELFSELIFLINKNKKVNRQDLQTAIDLIKSESTNNNDPKKSKKELDSVIVFKENGYIIPRSTGQEKFYKSVRENDFVFCIGPAGTGKTYLAVAIAVEYLKSKTVDKIILTRPAVEAGENLGFLPGDFKEKIDPYLRPLYDALSDMLHTELLKKYLDQRVIEVVPLAFMRGRTLNNAFVLLDEAQNTNFLQMKMFLTRLGFNSKCIVNGDVTQIDLPNKTISGLTSIQSILTNIDGIDFVKLGTEDVVRHKLVKKIIDAYSEVNNNSDHS